MGRPAESCLGWVPCAGFPVSYPTPHYCNSDSTLWGSEVAIWRVDWVLCTRI